MDIFFISDPHPHNNRCGSATLFLSNMFKTRLCGVEEKNQLACKDNSENATPVYTNLIHAVIQELWIQLFCKKLVTLPLQND